MPKRVVLVTEVPAVSVLPKPSANTSLPSFTMLSAMS